MRLFRHAVETLLFFFQVGLGILIEVVSFALKYHIFNPAKAYARYITHARFNSELFHFVNSEIEASRFDFEKYEFPFFPHKNVEHYIVAHSPDGGETTENYDVQNSSGRGKDFVITKDEKFVFSLSKEKRKVYFRIKKRRHNSHEN